MDKPRRFNRASQCINKRKFHTRKQASDAAKKSTISQHDRIEFYRCTWCQKYHIGHPVEEDRICELKEPVSIVHIQLT